MSDENDNWLLRTKSQCSLCCQNNLVQIIDLPSLPLTGIYLNAPDTNYPTYDQFFDYCPDCGHGQLRHVIDPAIIYNQTYTHRSSASPMAQAGNDFFFEFICEVIGDSKVNRVLEVGCNDLYLLNKLSVISDDAVGIDPIWKETEPPSSDFPGVRIIGSFIEEIKGAEDIGGPVDMIVSSHTFEHLEDPKASLEKIMKLADPGALICIEVPSLDTLLRLGRFDQIFHQHVQYFSLASFLSLFDNLGCEYLAHRFNYGYWGGTMMFAIRKANSKISETVHTADPAFVHQQFKTFQLQIDALKNYLSEMRNDRLYGFGAAQMLPVLAYHLNSDFSEFDAILDDNTDRQGMWLACLAPEITSPGNIDNLEDSVIMVTALDSSRAIIKRLVDLNPRHIIVPNMIH